MSSLLQLQKFLQDNLDLKRTGANAFFRDEHTLILSDKYDFRADHLRLIEVQFPHICIDIISSDASRSGFLVIFSGRSTYDRTSHRSYLKLFFHMSIFTFVLLWTCFWISPHEAERDTQRKI